MKQYGTLMAHNEPEGSVNDTHINLAEDRSEQNAYFNNRDYNMSQKGGTLSELVGYESKSQMRRIQGLDAKMSPKKGHQGMRLNTNQDITIQGSVNQTLSLEGSP